MTILNESGTPLLDTHEVRITSLESRVDTLERNHSDLKLTIMEENRDTRKFMQSLIERQFADESADRVREDDLRKARTVAMKDIGLAIFGAGGLIYGIIELFIK